MTSRPRWALSWSSRLEVPDRHARVETPNVGLDATDLSEAIPEFALDSDDEPSLTLVLRWQEAWVLRKLRFAEKG